MFTRADASVNTHDLLPRSFKSVVVSPQVHRARGIQGKPVRHKYRGHPLCTGQEQDVRGGRAARGRRHGTTTTIKTHRTSVSCCVTQTLQAAE